MAIVDVTVIPIGTKSASVSDFVAAIQEVLQRTERIRYQLTPMSTLIEGELADLFRVVQQIHEIPFQNGVQRVATNIRIDDRRDKGTTMEAKVDTVRAKMNKTTKK